MTVATPWLLAVACGFVVTLAAGAAPGGEAVGEFEGHGDVGTVVHPGSATFDPAKRAYTVTGSGENMWFAADAFHFAWKRVDKLARTTNSRSPPTCRSSAPARTPTAKPC